MSKLPALHIANVHKLFTSNQLRHYNHGHRHYSYHSLASLVGFLRHGSSAPQTVQGQCLYKCSLLGQLSCLILENVVQKIQDYFTELHMLRTRDIHVID